MRKEKIQWQIFLSCPLTVAAPDLLDPKSATHNTKPRLSFSTKPITLNPREESEVRQKEFKSNYFFLGTKSLLNVFLALF